MRQAGVPVKDHVLQGWPHGFGVGDGQWMKDFDQWVTNIFENNSQMDVFIIMKLTVLIGFIPMC